ncbi:hypothetical protein ACWFRF_34600 [Nocardia sp. NPDC055165]
MRRQPADDNTSGVGVVDDGVRAFVRGARCVDVVDPPPRSHHPGHFG